MQDKLYPPWQIFTKFGRKRQKMKRKTEISKTGEKGKHEAKTKPNYTPVGKYLPSLGEKGNDIRSRTNV